MRRLLTGLAALLSLGLVAPAVVADGHQTPRLTALNLPAMSAEYLPARAPDGRLLGTMIAPALVAPRAGPDRPVIVVFNGGPGAASGWLQLGLLGPLRAEVPDDPAVPPGAPVSLQPNGQGLWDITDILFVDPLGTGFSRPAAGVDPREIRDWRKDGDYIAGAVGDWLARRGRLGAPLILIGESYGAERAVAVADALRRAPRPARIAGLVLISQTITTDASLRRRDPNLAAAIGLPTVAATACQLGTSGLADRDPAACAERSQRFAFDSYLPVLAAGRAPIETRAELARITGLPAAELTDAGLVIDRDRYRRQALGGRVLGLYDSRYSAAVVPGRKWQDPSLDPLLAPLEVAARRNGRATLGLDRSPLDGSPYILFNPELHAHWRYGEHADPYGRIDIAGLLASVLRVSGARLLLAGGMFDSVGSYGGDRYLARQVRLPADRVTVRSYRAGHMFYLDRASREDFLPLLREFVRETNPTTA